MQWFSRWMTASLAVCPLLICATLPLVAQEPALLLEKMTLEGIENAFRVRPDLYSGGQPDEAGFAELAKLGVKTVISVDGAAPDLELAHKYGIRYVHLPMGYDGVPVEQQQKLVKARLTFRGPVYIHCHHGKHRGPAAVMALCRATDSTLSADKARDALKLMGTASRYAGLYASVAATRPPTVEELRRLPQDFPEQVEVSAMVEQMGTIDGAWDRLQAASKRGAASSDDLQKLLTVVVELEELVTEAGRLTDDDQTALKQAFAVSAEQIRREREALERARGSLTPDAFEQLTARLDQSCSQCHTKFRDRK